MKYVVFTKGGKRTPVTFPDGINHEHVAIAGQVATSAGFFEYVSDVIITSPRRTPPMPLDMQDGDAQLIWESMQDY